MTQREFNNKLMSIAQSKYPLPKPVESKRMRFYIPTLQPLLFEMGYVFPFSNDVFTWGYSAAQWGIILKTPEYYKLLQAAYLDITTSQIQAIESLYDAPKPSVDVEEKPSNAPQPVDKFAKQIYTAYWHEVKRGNIKEEIVKDWIERQDIKDIFDRCIKAGLIEQISNRLYKWVSNKKNEFAYFVFVINEQTDDADSISWQKYLSVFENNFKQKDLSNEVSNRIRHEQFPRRHLLIRKTIKGTTL